MNKQFSEIAKQAYEAVVNYTPSFLVTKQMIDEKFAELIVRKCAHIALHEDHDPYECIMSHFGVDDERTD